MPLPNSQDDPTPERPRGAAPRPEETQLPVTRQPETPAAPEPEPTHPTPERQLTEGFVPPEQPEPPKKEGPSWATMLGCCCAAPLGCSLVLVIVAGVAIFLGWNLITSILPEVLTTVLIRVLDLLFGYLLGGGIEQWLPDLDAYRG